MVLTLLTTLCRYICSRKWELEKEAYVSPSSRLGDLLHSLRRLRQESCVSRRYSVENLIKMDRIGQRGVRKQGKRQAFKLRFSPESGKIDPTSVSRKSRFNAFCR